MSKADIPALARSLPGLNRAVQEAWPDSLLNLDRSIFDVDYSNVAIDNTLLDEIYNGRDRLIG